MFGNNSARGNVYERIADHSRMENRQMNKRAQVMVLLLALVTALVPGAASAQVATPTAAAQQPPVDGNAAQPGAACQIFTLNRGADTWLNSQTPLIIYGADPKLTADGNPPSTALIRWDLSTIPAGTQVAFAAILVRHLDPKDESATIFQLYALRRPWSDKQATWVISGPGMRWAAPGVADPITDRESTSMGQTPILQRSPAVVRIDLNDEGVAQVNRWLSGIEPNYGIAIQDFKSGDAFRFGSFESSFPPQLVLSTCAQSPQLEAALPAAAALPTGSASPTAVASPGVTPAASPSPQATAAATAAPSRSPQAAAAVTASSQLSPLATPTAPAGSSAGQSVSFQDGVAPDSRYAGTQDTYVNQNAPGGTYGAARVAWLTGGGSTGMRASAQALVRWDVSTIPAGSEVVSATVTLNTVVASPGEYNVYEARRAWDEATLTWASGRNDSWFGEGAGWSEASAAPLGQYRPVAPGPVVIDLDAAGVAAVQRWIDDPSQNFGLVVANSRASTPANFETSEAQVPANRPKLTVTYR